MKPFPALLGSLPPSSLPRERHLRSRLGAGTPGPGLVTGLGAGGTGDPPPPRLPSPAAAGAGAAAAPRAALGGAAAASPVPTTGKKGMGKKKKGGEGRGKKGKRERGGGCARPPAAPSRSRCLRRARGLDTITAPPLQSRVFSIATSSCPKTVGCLQLLCDLFSCQRFSRKSR